MKMTKRRLEEILSEDIFELSVVLTVAIRIYLQIYKFFKSGLQ